MNARDDLSAYVGYPPGYRADRFTALLDRFATEVRAAGRADGLLEAAAWFEADDACQNPAHREYYAAELRALATAGQAPAPQPETCRCGETACESELCDCDSTPCPVDHAAEYRPAPQPETAPDAEPGTPDLREQYARLLLDSAGRLQPRHVADPDALIRDLLAARDDELADAQQTAENLTAEVRRLRHLKGETERYVDSMRTQLRAAEQQVAAALAELDRLAALDTVQHDDGLADSFSTGARWTIRMLRTALTPRNEDAEQHAGPDLGTQRRQYLTDAILAHGPGHQWRTGTVAALLTATGEHGDVHRNTARRMLHTLEDAGLLRRIDAPSDRYWITTGQDGGAR